ncbi:MAG: hypothetical protein IPL74_22465 [Bacteroidetes bacterium]|nr:hypothetical protein [Bacteroidota bacterium]
MMALKLVSNYVNLENYLHIDEKIDRVYSKCVTSLEWISNINDNKEKLGERTALKLEGIIKYMMGDLISSYDIFEKLDDDSELDLQLQYYYHKSAIELFPKIPFEAHTYSIQRGILNEIDHFIGKGVTDDDNLYYASLILFEAEDYQKVIDLAASTNNKSVELLRIAASSAIGQDTQVGTANILKASLWDFDLPEKVVQVSSNYMDWMSQLNDVIRYYEIEDVLNLLELSNPDQKRFWEMWSCDKLREEIRLERTRLFANNYEARMASGINPKVLKASDILTKDSIRTKFNDIKKSVESGDLDCASSIALAISGKQLSKKECHDFISYFLNQGQINKKDAMYLMLFTNYVYNLISEAVTTGFEASKKTAFNEMFQDLMTGLFELGAFISCTTAGGLCALTIKLASKLSFRQDSNELHNYLNFKEQFIKTVGAAIEEIGEEEFYKKYPVNELIER